MQNVGYNVLNRSKTLKSCVVGVCPINTLRTNKKSNCDYWAKADTPERLARLQKQGWVPDVL